jgi:C4-dicarboxylate-specific signal transduction histidine kinase
VLTSLESKDDEVTIHPELAAELPLINGHRGQLEQVIVNLVNYALEAMHTVTNRDRVLRVRTEVHGCDEIAVAVQDSGSGIDPKLLDSIFGVFVTTKAHGSGLGLAICRMIIEGHGDQLLASSDGKSGPLFQFVLPLRANADGEGTARIS